MIERDDERAIRDTRVEVPVINSEVQP